MEFFVTCMITDLWSNDSCEESKVSAPSFQQVFHAIASLNADTKTLVMMHGKDGSELCIRGGLERCVVYVAKSDEDIWGVVSSDFHSGITS